MAIGPGCQPSWARKESAGWARWARASPMCKEGDRTLVPFLHPAWAERIKTDAPWLRPLPPGDLKQFAMLGVKSADRISPADRHHKIAARIRFIRIRDRQIFQHGKEDVVMEI